ncbi:MAG: preprotein translocase subunit YajC [Actinobacteria bacterium]|nr:preprotein translocase subunit YajC [Actinomycetota bacterium]MCL6105535.1 preprotein translocase subunit YajC [Actinomycetota bacterium]
MFEALFFIAAASKGSSTASSGSAVGSILFFVLIFAVGYLLFIRPQQQKVKRQRSLAQAVDVGDKVVTSGGIIGEIERFEDDIAILEIAPNISIEVARAYIVQKLLPPAADWNEDDLPDTDESFDDEVDDMTDEQKDADPQEDSARSSGEDEDQNG